MHPSQVNSEDDGASSLTSCPGDGMRRDAKPRLPPNVAKDFHMPVRMALALSVHMMGVFNARERTVVCPEAVLPEPTII